MKFSRLFLLLVVIGLTATAAMADGIDPTVVIRQVDPAPTPITDPNGTIGVFASAQQNEFAFQNDTGKLLFNLTLTLFGINADLDFNFGEDAGDGIFAYTSKTVNSNGSVTLYFSGVDDAHTGLVAADCSTDEQEFLAANPGSYCQQCTGGIYTIEFDGIPNGVFVVGTASVGAPEPATLVLLSSGFLGIVALRKRRAILQN